jgi:pilus assembly protein CpaE
MIICPIPELASGLENALPAGEISVVRKLEQYPSAIDLARIVRAQGPQVVFLSFASPELALDAIRVLEHDAAGVQVVAVHSTLDAGILRESMRAGVREFLVPPFEGDGFFEALRNVRDLVERHQPFYNVTNDIFSFLPSKAGVGATTLAVNLSAAMAESNDSRVVLSDFDLNSGMLRFMLKLRTEFCVLDAVEHAHDIDEMLWPQLITSLGKLDLLHAGRVNPNLRIEPGQIRGLIQFMRRNYSALCFDLSGNLERYSLEIMQESRRVLLVCTPEIASLHLAREKMAYLRSLDLDSRVWVVLNRVPKKPLFTKEQVEDVLGLTVIECLPNDYETATRAVTEGTLIDPQSMLGKQYRHFAARLLGNAREKISPDPAKRRFLEFFSVDESGAAVQPR